MPAKSKIKVKSYKTNKKVVKNKTDIKNSKIKKNVVKASLTKKPITVNKTVELVKTKPVHHEVSNSYKSLLYGGITVVLLVSMAFGVFRIISQSQKKNIVGDGIKVAQNVTTLKTESNKEDVKENIKNDDEYTVAEGDTLWSISEKQLHSGYKWVELAKANIITNPNSIMAGQKLSFANIKTESGNQENIGNGVVSGVSTSANNTSDSSEYKVQKGDTLWDISVKMYGDGYKWPQVARANNLSNPNLIYSGNTLVLPK